MPSRRLRSALAVSGAAAIAGLALAAPATLADPPRDWVTGGGISAVDTRFGFTAHSNPSGGDAFGHATFKNFLGANSDRSGHVTCLRVSGNAAVFGIEDRNDDGTTLFRQFFIRDNGEPSPGGVAVDELREVGSGSPVPLSCSDPAQQGPGLILQEGNIEVRDA